MKALRALVKRFAGRRILVVGDVMVDHYIWGRVSRVSPEAPVPIVEVNKESQTLGGAGNVVQNLHALGALPILVGLVGRDGTGAWVAEALRAQGLETSGLFSDPSRPTTLKTRIIGSHQQIVRFDRESAREPSRAIQDSLTGYAEALAAKAAAVIISDYGKGVITRTVLERVIRAARRAGGPITVDPKVEHFQRYRGVTCITPNAQEASQGMRLHTVVEGDGVLPLGHAIRRKLNADSVLITRGEHGMSLFEKSGRVTHIPTVAREVYDVTGAGDTVIAALTLALAAGAALRDAARVANVAAGLVVEKMGTATVTAAELTAGLSRLR